MILAYLRRTAHSKTEEAYNQSKKDLIESDIWNMDQAHKLRESTEITRDFRRIRYKEFNGRWTTITFTIDTVFTVFLKIF